MATHQCVMAPLLRDKKTKQNKTCQGSQHFPHIYVEQLVQVVTIINQGVSFWQTAYFKYCLENRGKVSRVCTPQYLINCYCGIEIFQIFGERSSQLHISVVLLWDSNNSSSLITKLLNWKDNFGETWYKIKILNNWCSILSFNNKNIPRDPTSTGL